VFPKTEVGRVKEKLKKLTREWSEPYRPHMILAKATTNFRDLPVIEWGFHHCLFEGTMMEVKEERKIVELHRFAFGKN
jgi:hypothetical protein